MTDNETSADRLFTKDTSPSASEERQLFHSNAKPYKKHSKDGILNTSKNFKKKKSKHNTSNPYSSAITSGTQNLTKAAAGLKEKHKNLLNSPDESENELNSSCERTN